MVAERMRFVVLVMAVLVCGLLVPAAPALAQGPGCGTATVPTGDTAEGSFSQFQADVSNVGSGDSQTFFLTASLSDTGVSGGLQIPADANVTIDLGGCDLTITNPGTDGNQAGLAAIGVPAGSSLTIEDTSSSVLADQGTVTAHGAAAGSLGGGGAGIGGGGGYNAAGGAGGTVTISGGTIDTTGGAGGEYGGGGAGIGGGGGGLDESAGAGGTVTISGGTVETPTAGGGGFEGGGGAGIGGGGGGEVGSGGAGGKIIINAGTVDTPTGGAGRFFGGGGAGIGGGGGGYEASGGAGSTVTISGGTLGSPMGGAGENGGANGVGVGGGGNGPGYSGSAPAAGSVELAAGSSTLSGSVEIEGSFTVDAGAVVSVPSGDQVTLDDTTAGDLTNNGTIDLGGVLQAASPGGSTLVNNGSITVSGSGWSVDQQGGMSSSPPANWLGVSGNVFDLSFSSPLEPDVWVFAPTVVAGGQSLPALSAPQVSWADGSTVVTPGTLLSSVPDTVNNGVSDIALSGSTTAAATACGSYTPTGQNAGETGEATLDDLQVAINNLGTNGTGSFYLESSMDPSSGNLSIPDGDTVTVDLAGCDLTITNPGTDGSGAGLAAIGVPAGSSLTIEDTSSSVLADQGTVTAHGAAGDSLGGGGAGIGGGGGGYLGSGGAGGTVTISGGTVNTPTGGAGGEDGGGGAAGIGGGGGGAGESAGAGGSVTISGGTVNTPTGGGASNTGGGGAGIGGGGGGYEASGGAGGSVTISGGTVNTPTGGTGYLGGGGAGVGGGGGGGSESGGAGGTVTISGGTVDTPTGGGGGAGKYGSGGGAGIGGGGGGGFEASGGAGGTVTISGGTLGSPAGGAGGGGTSGVGVGGGGDGNGYSGSEPAAGSVEVAAGSSTLSGSVQITGSFTVDQRAVVSVPAGSTVELDDSTSGALVNNGTVDLGGVLQAASPGGSTLVNNGSITVSGSGWSVDQQGGTSSSPPPNWLGVSGNVFGLRFAVPAGDSAPADLWVFAPTVSGSGEALPTVPAPPSGSTGGVWANQGSAVTASTPLAGLAQTAGYVVLTATYTPIACSPGTFSTTGNEPCTPAAAGTYVPGSGATTQIACPAGTTSATGASSCTPTPTQTTTPTSNPTSTIQPASITAQISSQHPKTRAGWYSGPVTVTFACQAPSGVTVTGGCPAPVTLTHNGKNQTVNQTISTSSGGSANVSVTGINIDMTKPRVRVGGVRRGATYLANAPKPTCRATSPLSGIASCKLTVHRTRTRFGYRETIRAHATNNAGTSSTNQTSFMVDTVAINGQPGTPPGVYALPLGDDYQLVVISHTQPDYVFAAPYPQQPAGGNVPFTRDGTVNGTPRWTCTVHLPKALNDFPAWNIGINLNRHLTVLKLITQP